MFFQGIWRIPAGDVDRPGSFASHMSRSVLLLMEVLRDLNDHKMLLELCLHLRKVPEPDKYVSRLKKDEIFICTSDLYYYHYHFEPYSGKVGRDQGDNHCPPIKAIFRDRIRTVQLSGVIRLLLTATVSFFSSLDTNY